MPKPPMPMLARLAAFLVAWRRTILLVGGILTLLAAWEASGIRYDFTPQAIFNGENELVAASEQTKATFGHAENIIIVVLAARDEDDCLAPAPLAWQVEITRRLQTLPSVMRVDGLATFAVPRPRIGLSGRMRFVPTIRDRVIDEAESQLVREKVAQQRLLDETLVSKDRRAVAIVLQLDPSNKDISHIAEVVNKVETQLTSVPPPNGFDAFLGGIPDLRVKIVQGLKQDQLTIVPLCALVFMILQIIMFRSWTGVLISGAAILTGLAWTFASLVLLDQSLTIISNILPILLMIVGMSSVVHFLNGYIEQLEITPNDRMLAVRRTIQTITLACFLTSVTTALGFLSLLAARSQLLNDLGWQAALGIALFFLATVLACSCLLPLYRPAISDRAAPSRLARWAWYVGAIAVRFPAITLVVGIVLMTLAGLLGSGTVIDSNLLETFDEQHPQTSQMRLIEDQLGGFVPMEIILSSKSPDWYLSADMWQRLTELIEVLTEEPDVLKARSVVELLSEADRQQAHKPPLTELVGTDSARLSSRLQDAKETLERYAGDELWHRFATTDGEQLRILLNLRDSGTRETLALAERVEHVLRRSFPAELGVDYHITGESYVAAVALTQFISDLLYSLLGVSALIFLVIGLMLRSVRLGLISILPNVAPLIMTLGYLGMRGYTINMSNVIVFAISLGVAVDDTIHFLARFRAEARGEPDVTAAIRRTCLGTGRAVLMTTLLIVCGMAILLLSTFVPTRRFAELTGVTMVSALLGDLLLLPAMLKLFWRGESGK